jgi:Meiotically up-regulated gene 113
MSDLSDGQASEQNLLAVVYVLSNPAMPGMVKIGKTNQNDPNTRVAQLYTTGVPVPFTVEFACRVDNPDEVESAMHTAFAPQRVNPRREFFEIDPEQAVAVLKLLHVQSESQDATQEISNDNDEITEQDRSAADRLQKRRPNFDFSEMGIPMGAQLCSSRSDDIATVVEPKKVLFQSEKMSLSNATRRMMGTDYNLAPGIYWTYDGKLLREYYEEAYGDF